MTAMGLFALGLLLLLLGADSLLRGVAGFAGKAGLPATTTGVLLLGPVAAMPQLLVNGCALATGADDLALGHIVGGNLASLGLALGVAAIVNPLQAKMRLLGWQSIAVCVAAIALFAFGIGHTLMRWEGVVLVLAFAGVQWSSFQRVKLESDAVQAELVDFAETSTNTTQNLIRLGLGGALLFTGSRWVVMGAPQTGALLGLDAFASGASLVAVGSVLPSILLAVMAALREQGSVAVGQALGACLCNLLLGAGVFAILQPVPLVYAAWGVALPATIALAVLLNLLLRHGARVGRREGALLVCALVAWLAYVVRGAIS